jgi:hypothetical protein
MNRTGIRTRIAAGFLLLSSGCTTSNNPPADPVIRYRQTDDYYALLQIVDEHIDPAWNGRVSKADVLKFLGKGIDNPDLYPNAGADYWVYTSTRRLPEGSYLFIAFKDGYVQSLAWGSE